MNTHTLMQLDHVNFAYGAQEVLRDVSCRFEAGKVYVIIGRSGAGKTTLLSLMSGLTEPTDGTITVGGVDLKTMDPCTYRSGRIGVIFQSYNLLSKLTAVENVELSMEIAKQNARAPIERSSLIQRAYTLLEQVGLTRDEADRRILKLSGGQQQRVAIARALSYGPEIILADEPTGNLDEHTQAAIIDILTDLARQGKCVIVVTHSPAVAGRADEQIRLETINRVS
ncbi:ABC transporter ATP-binding protein [Pseudoramibacter faecis]|uniref:ABC transporter ATP-binding protein n=1 Tax=Pseudoramibacter faecis TaxID=3108534 RepID=UPI002E7A7E80|nr:ABC transporter ATP-binding protein [Pseudoramibacter sp. HA2172]